MPDIDERLSVEFELNVDDLIALNKNVSKVSETARKGRRQNFLYLWIIAALVFLYLLFLFLTRSSFDKTMLPWWTWVLVFLGASVFISLNARRKSTKLLRDLYSEGQGLDVLGQRETYISPIEIGEVMKYRRESVQWQAVHKVVATPDHLFVYITTITAFVIPKRAFQDESSFQHFADAAIAYHKAISPGNCKKCGYNLRGNVGGRCPECGESF